MRLALISMILVLSACGETKNEDVACSLAEARLEFPFKEGSAKASGYSCVESSGYQCEAYRSVDLSLMETNCSGSLIFDR